MSASDRVVVDEREKASGLPEMLKELGLMVEYRMLEVGDYVISGHAIERKESRDFVSSLYSGRIFDQAERLHETYEKALLVVEGDIDSLMDRHIKPRAYWGALAALTFDYGLKVFFTSDIAQTANLICTLIRRKPVKLKGLMVKRKPKVDNLEKMQLLAVSTLPGIGPKLGDRLLTHFETVRKVFMASIAELCAVRGVGRVKAHRIAEVLEVPYRPFEKRPQQLKLNA